MRKILVYAILMFSYSIFGQSTRTHKVFGKVLMEMKSKISGLSIIRITIKESSTSQPYFFDVPIKNNGTFSFEQTLNFKIKPYSVTVNVSISGLRPYEKSYQGNEIPNSIRSSSGWNLGTIKLRGKVKEKIAPVEQISESELERSGQITLGKALHYLSSSFNSSSQPISDGGAHFDPTDYRNLGSSRVLFLINGIRKNVSAHIQVNDIPTKGEVGVDIRSIPLAAIRSVYIEKQEKTTLYGSDAIAGAIDFKLKGDEKEDNLLVIHGYTGVNKDNWDGLTYGMDFNKGFVFGRSFVNVTYSNLTQQESNRPNVHTSPYDSLFISSRDSEWQTWLNNHPSLGMRIGSPNMSTNTVFYNSKLYESSESENHLYSFGGMTKRSTQSYAIFRAPYWVKDSYNIFSVSPSSYEGFQPTFESSVSDDFFVFGYKGKSIFTPSEENTVHINYDLSQTISSNDIDYTVNNSFNPSLGNSSPTSFQVGGYTLDMKNTKFVVDWQFASESNKFSTIAMELGSEFRSEKYQIKSGEANSYTGEGVISYIGNLPQNSLTANRNNFGTFINGRINDLFNKKVDVETSLRYEKYYGFPENIAKQAAAIYRAIDERDTEFTLRGSWSTGFRAPSLQQLYYSRVQTLVSGNTVSNRGTFNTFSSILTRQLGIPELKSEYSESFSAGTILRLGFFKFVADLYQTSLKDRIVLSSNLDSVSSASTSEDLKKILKSNNISSMNFFLNAVNTKLMGLDLALSYNYLLNSGLKLDLSATMNTTLINELSTSEISSKLNNVVFFDRKEQSRLQFSRPKNKYFFNVRLDKADLWSVLLNYSVFGEVKWYHPTDTSKDQTFRSKGLINLVFEKKWTRVGISLGINNLFNVYPDPIQSNGDPRTDVGGRFKYYREVNQFDYNGTSFLLKLCFKI